jgi:hypothetical protein
LPFILYLLYIQNHKNGLKKPYDRVTGLFHYLFVKIGIIFTARVTIKKIIPAVLVILPRTASRLLLSFFP